MYASWIREVDILIGVRNCPRFLIHDLHPGWFQMLHYYHEVDIGTRQIRHRSRWLCGIHKYEKELANESMVDLALG